MTPVHELLSKNAAFAAEYDRFPFKGLSNHLPMTLLALSGLGASQGRLEKEFARQSKWLRPLEPVQKQITRENWRDTLGQVVLHSSYAAFFHDEIEQKGIKDTLARYVPPLVPGLSGGAFHGLIRTAYGESSGVTSEVAHGLAYWCGVYFPLGPCAGSALSEDPARVLQMLRVKPLLARKARSMSSLMGRVMAAVRGKVISDLMSEISALSEFREVGGSLKIGDGSLRQIAQAMVALYSATGNFTALHGVTGTHAFRLLLPYMGERKAALSYLWQGLAAAWLTIGMPSVRLPAASRTPPWEDITGRALDATDEHDIKLVYSCKEEAAHYGADEAYRIAAARRLGMK